MGFPFFTLARRSESRLWRKTVSRTRLVLSWAESLKDLHVTGNANEKPPGRSRRVRLSSAA